MALLVPGCCSVLGMLSGRNACAITKKLSLHIQPQDRSSHKTQLIFAERWQARTGTMDDGEPGSGSASGSGSGATKKELASLRAELKQETSFIQELVVRFCLLASLCLLAALRRQAGAPPS